MKRMTRLFEKRAPSHTLDSKPRYTMIRTLLLLLAMLVAITLQSGYLKKCDRMYRQLHYVKCSKKDGFNPCKPEEMSADMWKTKLWANIRRVEVTG